MLLVILNAAEPNLKTRRVIKVGVETGSIMWCLRHELWNKTDTGLNPISPVADLNFPKPHLIKCGQ